MLYRFSNTSPTRHSTCKRTGHLESCWTCRIHRGHQRTRKTEGQPGSALSAFRWGRHDGLLYWCENFPGGGRRPGVPVRSEMSQPDSDGLDLSYRITPEYMSRCSQIHTGTRLTKLTSNSTYYCSYCCFCFPIPKSSLQVIQTMAPSGYITAKISVKM